MKILLNLLCSALWTKYIYWIAEIAGPHSYFIQVFFVGLFYIWGVMENFV